MEQKTHFFSKDKDFYRSLFSMLVVVAMQNLISYSVNMADNIMLGHYSQQALSGAALVNQIFFMVNQLTVAVGDSLIVISSQYWGQKRTEPVRRIAGTVLRIAFCVGIVIIVLCTVFSRQLLGIFTTDPEILDQGEKYLAIIKYTFLLLLLTQVLLATLRSVETVKIAFYISCVSLVINVCVNSTLIFGRFGFPELGIVGAATGTIISRFRLCAGRDPDHHRQHALGGLCPAADRDPGASQLRRHRGELCRHHLLPVHEGDRDGHVLHVGGHDGENCRKG